MYFNDITTVFYTVILPSFVIVLGLSLHKKGYRYITFIILTRSHCFCVINLHVYLCSVQNSQVRIAIRCSQNCLIARQNRIPEKIFTAKLLLIPLKLQILLVIILSQYMHNKYT